MISVLNLNVVDADLIPGVPYGPPSPPVRILSAEQEAISEHCWICPKTNKQKKPTTTTIKNNSKKKQKTKKSNLHCILI